MVSRRSRNWGWVELEDEFSLLLTIAWSTPVSRRCKQNEWRGRDKKLIQSDLFADKVQFIISELSSTCVGWGWGINVDSSVMTSSLSGWGWGINVSRGTCPLSLRTRHNVFSSLGTGTLLHLRWKRSAKKNLKQWNWQNHHKSRGWIKKVWYILYQEWY